MTKTINELLEWGVKEFAIEPKGIVHIGGHQGQEGPGYKKLTDNILFIEPIPKYAKQLRQAGYKVKQMAAWHQEEMLPFYVTTYDQGSSVLKPIDHKVSRIIEVRGHPLRHLELQSYNIMVLDTQGSELLVLQGAELKDFDIIICELNYRKRYINAAMADDVQTYLEAKGFEAVGGNEKDSVVSDVLFVRWPR